MTMGAMMRMMEKRKMVTKLMMINMVNVMDLIST